MLKATLVLTSQEILPITSTLKAHYLIRSSSPFEPILSHKNSIHNFPNYSFKTLFLYYPRLYGCISQVSLDVYLKNNILVGHICLCKKKMFITSLKVTCSWIVRVLLKGRQQSLFPVSVRSISVIFFIECEEMLLPFRKVPTSNIG